MFDAYSLIDRLQQQDRLQAAEFAYLLMHYDNQHLSSYLFSKSQQVLLRHFGKGVYIRGLIEISSYCKNNCNYCGLRHQNTKAKRYRLQAEQILDCCQTGYDLGFRTFVLQGGEDPFFTDDFLVSLLKSIRHKYPECAITLSLGERSRQSYQKLFEAGANRYLLRHEAVNPELYQTIHPKNMSLVHRLDCLKHLKNIGYQTGTGFMVGVPGQTIQNLAEDLAFIQQFQPHMVGIGPFMPAHGTPFENCIPGNDRLTVFLIGLLRLMLPKANLPATTALASLNSESRLKALQIGANVVMPNLSPLSVRKKYSIYDHKKSSHGESAQHLKLLADQLKSIDRTIDYGRGDYDEKKRGMTCTTPNL